MPEAASTAQDRIGALLRWSACLLVVRSWKRMLGASRARRRQKLLICEALSALSHYLSRSIPATCRFDFEAISQRISSTAFFRLRTTDQNSVGLLLVSH